MAKEHILSDEEKNRCRLAKRELKQYQNDLRYVTAKLNKIEEIRTVLEKTTTFLTPGKSFSGGESPDKFADGISKIEELKGKLSKKTLELMQVMFSVEDKIDSLPSPYRDLLFYRYSQGLDWREVAYKINYNEKYVTDVLHKEALYLYSRF